MSLVRLLLEDTSKTFGSSLPYVTGQNQLPLAKGLRYAASDSEAVRQKHREVLVYGTCTAENRRRLLVYHVCGERFSLISPLV
jgi:hypothetical protein